MHVILFKSMMLLIKDVVHFLCQIFVTFLEKFTLLLFSTLLARPIHDFVEFLQAFINHFSSSRIYQKMLDFLNNVKQGPNELLKDYLIRFNVVAI